MNDAKGLAIIEPRSWLDATALTLVGVMATAPLWLPLQALAQGIFSVVIGATGLTAWFRQRHSRVCAVLLNRELRRLRIRTAGGLWMDVIRVHTSVIGPSLISARLVTDAGQTLTIFLPRWVIAPEVHKRLCRLLLAGHRLTSAMQDQSSRELGT